MTMTTQLKLIDGGNRSPWGIDARTRAIARRGLARARQELERVRPAVEDEPLDRAG